MINMQTWWRHNFHRCCCLQWTNLSVMFRPFKRRYLWNQIRYQKTVNSVHSCFSCTFLWENKNFRFISTLTVTRLRYNFILVSKLISEKAYYVKGNVVLQDLCPSSNCLYTKSAEIHDVTALERRSWMQISRI